MPVIACPRCQQPLALDAAVLGQHVQCPKCQQVFQTAVAPAVPPAAPVPSAPRKVVATPVAPPPQSAAPPPIPVQEATPPAAAFDPATAFAGLGETDSSDVDDDDDRRASRRGRQPKKKGILVPLLIVGGIVLLACCVGGGFLANYLVNKANPPLAFTPFTAKDGSCSVLMPGPPIDGPIGTLAGDATGASYFYRHPIKDVELVLVYTDYPTDPETAKLVDAFYANEPEVHGMGIPGAAQTRKTPVKLGTLSGTDHVYEVNGKVSAVIRILEAKGGKQRRKVMLVAKGLNLPEEDRSKFLNSYKQLKTMK